jgi:hypothetical protein
VDSFDPRSVTANTAAAAAAEFERQWAWMMQHEYASALALALDVHLRGETADAQSALELLNDALQEVRQPYSNG